MSQRERLHALGSVLSCSYFRAKLAQEFRAKKRQISGFFVAKRRARLRTLLHCWKLISEMQKEKRRKSQLASKTLRRRLLRKALKSWRQEACRRCNCKSASRVLIAARTKRTGSYYLSRWRQTMEYRMAKRSRTLSLAFVGWLKYLR